MKLSLALLLVLGVTLATSASVNKEQKKRAVDGWSDVLRRSEMGRESERGRGGGREGSSSDMEEEEVHDLGRMIIDKLTSTPKQRLMMLVKVKQILAHVKDQALGAMNGTLGVVSAKEEWESYTMADWQKIHQGFQNFAGKGPYFMCAIGSGKFFADIFLENGPLPVLRTNECKKMALTIANVTRMMLNSTMSMSVANLRQGVRDHHSEIHALAVADITCLRDRLMTSFAESEQLPDAVSENESENNYGEAFRVYAGMVRRHCRAVEDASTLLTTAGFVSRLRHLQAHAMHMTTAAPTVNERALLMSELAELVRGLKLN